MRVASFLPGATEVLFSLGLEPVAVSASCDYPPAARTVPVAVRPRFDPGTDRAEINSQVARAVAGDGVFRVDDEALREADPDLILTQGICEVCAIDGAHIEAAVDRLDLDAAVLAIHSHRLDDVLDDVARIGRATGRESAAADLRAALDRRIGAVARRSAGRDEQPTVVVFDWTDPVMVAGHWVPELVETASGHYGLAEPGDPSRPRQWDAIRSADPEVIVVAPCGFTREDALETVEDLVDRPGWAEVSAVREGRVYAMDGNGHVNRPGPRLVDTLEAIAPLIHPDRFDDPDPDIVTPVVAASPS